MASNNSPFRCGVCGVGEDSEEEWFDHLIRKPHLRRSRRQFDFVGWKPEEKKRSILIFSNFPLMSSTDGDGVQHQQDTAGVITLLQKGGYSGGGVAVRDLVLWTEKPFLGLIQFISKRTMNGALKKLEATKSGGLFQIKLDDEHLLQATKLSEISDIELSRIIPAKLPMTTAAESASGNQQNRSMDEGEDIEEGEASLQILDDDDEQMGEGGGGQAPSRPTPVPVVDIDDDLEMVSADEDEEEGLELVTEDEAEEEENDAVVSDNEETQLNAALRNLIAGSSSSRPRNDISVPWRKRPLEESSQVSSGTSGTPTPSKKSKSSGGGDRRTGHSNHPVSELYKMAQRQRWRPPEFSFTTKPSTGKHWNRKKEYSCTVIVNGVEYKTDDASVPARGFNKKQAKRNIAEFCLKKLSSGNPPTTLTTGASSSSSPITSNANNYQQQAPPPVAPPPALAGSTVQDGEVAGSSRSIRIPVPSFSSSSNSNQDSNSLQNQLRRLRNTVLISSQDASKVLEVVTALNSLFRRKHPEANVLVFRNYSLWLKNASLTSSTLHNDELYVYHHPFYINDFPENLQRAASAIQNLLNLEEHFRILETLQDNEYRMEYRKNGLIFHLVMSPRVILEVQMCRLLKYLCTFDRRRCDLIMTLAYYWTKVNSVSFGNPSDPDDLNANQNHEDLPEQLTLQWLVMFFLINRGVVPSPGEIQQRSHNILKDGLEEKDLGFNLDSDFARNWQSAKKREATRDNQPTEHQECFSVLELFQEFLQFCGDVLTVEGWNGVLNTRNGRIISKESFTNRQRSTAASSSASAAAGRHQDNLRYQQLNMINPFTFKCNFSISRDILVVFKLMGNTGVQLKAYLETWSENGASVAVDLFGTLESVLTIDELTRSSVTRSLSAEDSD